MLTFRSNRNEPLHEQGAERLRQYIRRRHLRAGDTIPRIQDLCSYLNISYVTVHKALAVLSRKGLVAPIRGKGTFVTKRGAAETGPIQIGLVAVGTYDNMLTVPYRLDMFRGVVSAASAGHADVRMFSMKDPAGRLTSRQLQQMEIDGLLVLELADPAILRRFARSGVPVIAADSCVPDVPLDYVVCDDEGAVEQVVRHLVDLGHRRIHFAGGFAVHPVTRAIVESWSTTVRRNGYMAAMRGAGLTPVCHTWRDRSPIPGRAAEIPRYREMARRILAARPQPTAIVGYDGDVCRKLLPFLTEAGMRVPRDLSLVAVACATTDTQAKESSLSHCAFDFRELGMQSTGRLLDRFRDPAGPLEQAAIHRIGFTFVPGGTCSPWRGD